ncbi:MAG: 2-phosphosulfolactate phosphatase [Acidimicrobiales bacterium]
MADVRDGLAQRDSGVRFDWGSTGCLELSVATGCVAVVDVLTFTTAVSIATARGIAVLPLSMDAEDPEGFAASRRAQLAVGRQDMTTERPWSLSPASLAAGPWVNRLVLPSPNGALVALVAEGAVVAACLRNAEAVARWIVARGYGTLERPALIVASGERWSDGSLRPALEDALGAGAVLSHLAKAGLPLSAEASAMAAMFEGISDLDASLRACASARELKANGYERDVDAALELDADKHVPLLRLGAFSAASDLR